MTDCFESPPSVSVVIPCWNGERWIARAINSALDQKYPKLEVIVIDDGSSDRSLEVIRSFGDEVRWATGPNSGACTARNRGLELSNSDYVMFLDADDYIEPNSLSAWLRAACEAGADIVFGPYAYERGSTRTIGRSPSEPINSRSLLCQWLEGWFTPTCSVLWRHSFVASIGGWNPKARQGPDDGELAMRALLSDACVSVANGGLGVYVRHDSPHRLSQRAGATVVACELALLRNLWEIAQARGHEYARSSFSHAFYSIAYEAFAGGVGDVGHEALREARRLGLKGHVGSLTHRALANVLGLPTKLRLTGLLKGRKLIQISDERTGVGDFSA
jgi:hypothetical protein